MIASAVLIETLKLERKHLAKDAAHGTLSHHELPPSFSRCWRLMTADMLGEIGSDGTRDHRRRVTIVMPALNEARYIGDAIRSLVPSEHEIDYELVVMDGGSSDATRSIVHELAAENPRIRLIENPGRIQACAVNLAARMAAHRYSYMLRADCHAAYPDRFVARCITSLERSGAASLVVPMRTVGRTCVQRAIAAAQNSRLGNGGAAHRAGAQSGDVDHGHHAAFRVDEFLGVGGYDECFTHNEDAEFDLRLIGAGRRIFLDHELAITYFPRSDFHALARQYERFGWGRASTLLKHRIWPRPRQLLPVLILAGCAMSLLAALAHDRLFLLVPAAYPGVCLGWGLAQSVAKRDSCIALSGLAAMVMHMSWAAGFVRRVAGSVAR